MKEFYIVLIEHFYVKDVNNKTLCLSCDEEDAKHFDSLGQAKNHIKNFTTYDSMFAYYLCKLDISEIKK